MKEFNNKLLRIHLWLFIIGGVLVLGSYILGKFGGREYWAFPPVLAIFIVAAWLLFIYNIVSNLKGYKVRLCNKLGGYPVYLWMWLTGLVFFFFTFLEVYAWIIPYFKSKVIIFIYGTALFVMTSIHNDNKTPCSKLTYFFYLLGLANLMLGWAHHVYPVPNAKWIRHLAYFISMTELLVLAKLIWDWKGSLPKLVKDKYSIQYRLLFYTDLWIFLNLILAIAMSIPAINVYTHGTHITVAHAMGTTIGINTSILLATILFVYEDFFNKYDKKVLKVGFYLFQIGLLVFWFALIFAGIYKGYHRTVLGENFYEYREGINNFLWVVYIASFLVLAAFIIMFGVVHNLEFLCEGLKITGNSIIFRFFCFASARISTS